MARQDLTPEQAIHFLQDSCCALQTLQKLPDSEVAPGAKILLAFIKKAVCSSAYVLDDAIDIENGGEK